MANEPKPGENQQPRRRAMLHKVLNHAEHDFHQARSTVRMIEGTDGKSREDIHSASAMPWIEIPRAGLRIVEEKNLQTGKVEKVRKMTPGEATLTDEQLDFLKASPVCKHWLQNDPNTNRQQVVVVESFPAPEAAKSAAA